MGAPGGAVVIGDQPAGEETVDAELAHPLSLNCTTKAARAPRSTKDKFNFSQRRKGRKERIKNLAYFASLRETAIFLVNSWCPWCLGGESFNGFRPFRLFPGALRFSI
jgi:hypothetical protein